MQALMTGLHDIWFAQRFSGTPPLALVTGHDIIGETIFLVDSPNATFGQQMQLLIGDL